MKITIFRTPKPQRFEYQPRYYDERADRRARTKQISDELRKTPDSGPDLDQIRSDLRDKWQRKRSVKRRDLLGSKWVSLALAAVIILLILYIFFFVPIL